MSYIEVLKFAINPTGYAINTLMESSRALISNSSSQDIEKLEDSARRVEIQAYALQSQAKVEQELAIARRIMCAEEVEIEEQYDGSGDGSAGVKVSEKGVSLGISGSGRLVTKRIIKFKGFNEQYVQEIKSELNQLELKEPLQEN
ncbi:MULTISPECIES: hypothetical protein [unclassified Providencia]|uniref:hypothetical protein n=1 Tax=unclassified Providencia TaxID=2633465 RepID=UPI002349DFA5|nr:MULTISPECIES: hypothetical protein [unclassified Providencia]